MRRSSIPDMIMTDLPKFPTVRTKSSPEITETRAVAEQRLHEQVHEERVEPVEQDIEEEIAPRLEPESVEQEIRHPVDERLELVGIIAVEEGGLRLRHVEVVVRGS